MQQLWEGNDEPHPRPRIGSWKLAMAGQADIQVDQQKQELMRGDALMEVL
jgi:hypothetical protein